MFQFSSNPFLGIDSFRRRWAKFIDVAVCFGVKGEVMEGIVERSCYYFR